MKIETFVDADLESAHIGPFAETVHGHTWLVRVWFATSVRAPRNLSELRDALGKVLDPLDHAVLDDRLGRENATCEGLAAYILIELRGLRATRVQVWREHGHEPGGAEVSA